MALTGVADQLPRSIGPFLAGGVIAIVGGVLVHKVKGSR
jgi:hypothetical protein